MIKDLSERIQRHSCEMREAKFTLYILFCFYCTNICIISILLKLYSYSENVEKEESGGLFTFFYLFIPQTVHKRNSVGVFVHDEGACTERAKRNNK